LELVKPPPASLEIKDPEALAFNYLGSCYGDNLAPKKPFEFAISSQTTSKMGNDRVVHHIYLKQSWNSLEVHTFLIT
jgi:hypothetical protein